MFEALFPRVSFRHSQFSYAGPLSSGEYLFTIVDYYSRWLEVVVMTKTTNADKVVKELDKLFTIYGLSASIATDNGPHFLSGTFKRYKNQLLNDPMLLTVE
jgi:transposase InsO family protein